VSRDVPDVAAMARSVRDLVDKLVDTRRGRIGIAVVFAAMHLAMFARPSGGSSSACGSSRDI
jgi:hypothetical protein